MRNICQAANAVRQQQSQLRGRAATLLNSLPPDLASSSVLEVLARGVEGQHRGGVSIQRLGELTSMNAFHQVCRPAGGAQRGRSPVAAAGWFVDACLSVALTWPAAAAHACCGGPGA